MRLRHLLPASALLLGAALFAAGCDSAKEEAPPASRASAASKPTSKPAKAAAAGEVVWPELRRLDELSHRASALAKKKDAAGLKELAGDLRAAASALASSAIPENAKDAAQTKVLVGDVASLADLLGDDPAALADDALTSAAASFFPVVEQLMASAGLPHVHAKPGEDDEHDHDGHDHDGHDHGAEAHDDHDAHADHDHDHDAAHEDHDHAEADHDGHGH